MVEQEPMKISKAPSPRPDGGRVGPSRVISVTLLVWMLGVMMLSWVLFNGPVVSSIIKRVEFLRNLQEVLVGFFGG